MRSPRAINFPAVMFSALRLPASSILADVVNLTDVVVAVTAVVVV